MKTRAKALEQPTTGKRHIDFKLLELYDACVANAQALIGDAKILLERQRVPRAYALAYTAIEELGKSQVVADYFYELVTSAEFETAFREHRFKMAYAKRYVAIPDDLSQEWFVEYDPRIKTPAFQSRNAALYVEHAPDNSPRTPAQTTSPERAAELVATAEAYLVEICRMAAFSERIGTKAFTK